MVVIRHRFFSEMDMALNMNNAFNMSKSKM